MKTAALVLFALFLLPFTPAGAQTDDSRLLYDDAGLGRVDISIDTVSLKWIYAHVQSDSEHAATFRFRLGTVDETVDSIGFRLRGNTSRDAKKKSFKVSFNTFTKGGRFHGVKGMNLNGEHNDPTMMRSKLSFDLFRDAGVPAPRANHMRVYINGAYYGLYVSVEHIDDEFLHKYFADDTGNLWKCLYPADLRYLGTSQDVYKAVMNNPTTPAYELKTNEAAGDFSAFVKFVDVINNTTAGALADSADRYVCVPRVLQYLAFNVFLGQWDGYHSNMNNYYLYHIPSENAFTVIPYDYDNTFGIDWFNKTWATADPYAYPKISNGARPLSERLLSVDRYRDLYTHFIRFYRENVFMLRNWEARVDRIKDLIGTAAAEDAYRTLDYGFTMRDFNDSYSASAYQRLHVKNGLKQYVVIRAESIANQLGSRMAPAAAYAVGHSPRRPAAGDSILVTASCYGYMGIKTVTIEFTTSTNASTQTAAMRAAPVPNTQRVEEADRWTGAIPPLGTGASCRYRITVRDSLDRVQFYPRQGYISIPASQAVVRSAVINEFMADNSTIADPVGQYDDWLELFNPTSEAVVLTNTYLTDNPAVLTKWKFTQPNLVLAPGAYLTVWCDEDASQAGIHTNFKLGAGGEFIALTMEDGMTVMDSVTFGAQTKGSSFGRSPNGAGTWTRMTPTPGAANATATGVTAVSVAPEHFSVEAFPNPFNPSTTIRYSLPERGAATATIFDVLGREVWSSRSGMQESGSYTLLWNGMNSSGTRAGSGVYLLRVTSGNRSASVRLMMLK